MSHRTESGSDYPRPWRRLANGTWIAVEVIIVAVLASCAPANEPPEWPPHAAQRGYCADWRAF